MYGLKYDGWLLQRHPGSIHWMCQVGNVPQSANRRWLAGFPRNIYRGGTRPPLESPNHQLFWAQITKSPSFFGQNHHHQLSRSFCSKLDQIRGLNLHFDEILPTSANTWNFTCKSPNHQDFTAKITKSPLFFEVNHHHHTFLESPNHQLFLVQITKSPFNFGLNHQSPKRLVPPPISTKKRTRPRVQGL